MGRRSMTTGLENRLKIRPFRYQLLYSRGSVGGDEHAVQGRAALPFALLGIG